MAQTSATLTPTPLTGLHRAQGARMVGFAGWNLPLEFSGITDEHLAVRTAAGLFDVSHMGELEIAGADALAVVQRLTANDASRLTAGRAQYSALTTAEGTIVDDVLVYQLADGHYLLVVNAANIDKDVAWIRRHLTAGADAALVNTSTRYALIAVQGPRAARILQPLTGVDLEGLGAFEFATGEVGTVRATISRTGYTGEDGFELFVAPAAAERVWTSLARAGEPDGLRPAGLGARDTLRLEAALRLAGQDIDETTTVLEAGLGWIVGWEKDDFVGKPALEAQRATGVRRRLVGFEMLDRGIARHGYEVIAGDEPVGRVTSGTRTPFLKQAIGMAYVPVELARPGTEWSVDVRGRRLLARVVKMPFYRRPASPLEP